MKKNLIYLLAVAFIFTFTNQNVKAQKEETVKKEKKVKEKKVKKVKKKKGEPEPFVLKTKIDSLSYALGIMMSNNIKKDFPEGNSDAFIQGYKNMTDSATLTIPKEDAEKMLQEFFTKKQQEAQAKQQQGDGQQAAAQYEKIKQEGMQFLEENKKKEGVKVTASGLQYLVIKEGTGKSPSATSNITVHYHGTTPEGVVFDSSVDRGEPISFNLNQVIAGWTEGLQLMKEGAKYKLFIPQELAYGANAPQGGQGPIKPFMPLIFEVELITVNN